MTDVKTNLILVAALLSAVGSITGAVVASRVYTSNLAKPVLRTGNRANGFMVKLMNTGGRPVAIVELGIMRYHRDWHRRGLEPYQRRSDEHPFPNVLPMGETWVYYIPWESIAEWIALDRRRRQNLSPLKGLARLDRRGPEHDYCIFVETGNGEDYFFFRDINPDWLRYLRTLIKEQEESKQP